MDESKKQRAKIADISTMTTEQQLEFISLRDGITNIEEYVKRVDEFYKKHNLRSATLEERWEMDAESYK